MPWSNFLNSCVTWKSTITKLFCFAVIKICWCLSRKLKRWEDHPPKEILENSGPLSITVPSKFSLWWVNVLMISFFRWIKFLMMSQNDLKFTSFNIDASSVSLKITTVFNKEKIIRQIQFAKASTWRFLEKSCFKYSGLQLF